MLVPSAEVTLESHLEDSFKHRLLGLTLGFPYQVWEFSFLTSSVDTYMVTVNNTLKTTHSDLLSACSRTADLPFSWVWGTLLPAQHLLKHLFFHVPKL